MCEPTGSPTLRMAFGVANATVEFVTKVAFRGTALEGDDLCEEHWSALRALATLP